MEKLPYTPTTQSLLEQALEAHTAYYTICRWPDERNSEYAERRGDAYQRFQMRYAKLVSHLADTDTNTPVVETTPVPHPRAEDRAAALTAQAWNASMQAYIELPEEDHLDVLAVCDETLKLSAALGKGDLLNEELLLAYRNGVLLCTQAGQGFAGTKTRPSTGRHQLVFTMWQSATAAWAAARNAATDRLFPFVADEVGV